ncbi:RraA family protein [Streptomyces sp. NPDC002787]
MSRGTARHGSGRGGAGTAVARARPRRDHLRAGRRARTVVCHEDNGLLRELLRTPGDGHVLVVDGSASPRTALVGDLIATAAQENGWAGLFLHGAVRDADDDGIVLLPRDRPDGSAQPAAFRMSSATRVSVSAVSSVRAYVVGHRAPSSSRA